MENTLRELRVVKLSQAGVMAVPLDMIPSSHQDL